jgi:hypothetical protein
MCILKTILLLIRAFLLNHVTVTAENLALRQQLAVVTQSVKRPKLRPRDRVFWVLLRAPLAEMAFRVGDRPTGYGDTLAPTRISVVLALEVEVQEAGKTEDRTRSPCSDSTYVQREPDLGCAQDSVRVELARTRAGRENRRQVYGPHSKASFSDLANVPGESRT